MPNDGQWYGVSPQKKPEKEPEARPVFSDAPEPENLNLNISPEGEIDDIHTDFRVFQRTSDPHDPWRFFWPTVMAILTAHAIMALVQLIAGLVTFNIVMDSLHKSWGGH